MSCVNHIRLFSPQSLLVLILFDKNSIWLMAIELFEDYGNVRRFALATYDVGAFEYDTTVALALTEPIQIQLEEDKATEVNVYPNPITSSSRV